MMKKISVGVALVALLGVLALGTSVKKAEAAVPPPGPPVPENWCMIDFEDTVDPEFSHCDNYTFQQGFGHIFYAYVDYKCDAAGYKLTCDIYDEQLGQWKPMNVLGGGGTVYTSPAAETKQVVFYYTIQSPAYDDWIDYIDLEGDGGDLGSVVATLKDAASVVDEDGPVWITDLLNNNPNW